MVSPRKSTSTLSLIPEERYKMMPSSTKSCESLYSNTSSSKGSATVLYRRKMNAVGINNSSHGSRQATLIPATSEVRKRVLSARRLRMKTYQNQLADAQQTIAELAHENRILRTLHKRQDSALSKYESTNAELPQLLHSHAEELRVWQTKYRNLQTLNKDLEHKLKQKEAIILSLSDQNKYYSQLNKDKNLEERQRLTEKLHSLEARLQEKDNDMKLMARKVQLEAKNLKQQIHNEQKKTKEVMLKLEKTRLELSGYRKLEELAQLPEKFANIALRRKKNIDDELKFEANLEKFVEKPAEFKERYTLEETDYPTSHRSTKSNTSLSKIEMSSTRTMRKMNAPIAPSLQYQPKSATHQRRMDRGDGDAPTIINGDLMKNSNKQQNAHTLQERSTSNEYEDDYENPNGNDDADDNDDDVEDDGDGNVRDDKKIFNINGITEQNVIIDVEEALDDDALDEKNENGLDDDAEEGEDDDDGDDDTDVIITTTTKTSSRMKEEISSIRKQISDDYKEREAFLDTFCRQATNSVLREESTSKKCNSITLGRNIPSSRKHKLLAALKAIDDNKSQD